MQDTSAAFVTLRARQLRSIVASSRMSVHSRLWRTHAAPDPCDVLWRNAQWRSWERGLRGVLGWTLFAALVLLFVPVVAFVQSLINLETYAQRPGGKGAWARDLLAAPVIGSARHRLLRPYCAL